MCGFVGYMSTTPQEKLAHFFQSHTSLLAHRGPDAFGHYVKDHQVGLFHWRLSIQDLSEGANQPFYSQSGRYVIVFNGEVYNFKELAQKLQISTKTHADTEVLIEAFERLGTSFVAHLNGMFSIAIYDQQTQSLYLFRDRLGIKPLYYYHQDGILLFASELKGIKQGLAQLNVSTTINKQAVANFLHLGYIPEHQSIYQSVKKFPKGHIGHFQEGMLSQRPFWKANEQVKKQTFSNVGQAKQELDQLLHQSVERRLIADVPVGCFLSGGTDSSLVTAIAQQQHPEKIKTFSIGFKESKFNEAIYAKQVANHLGTDHFEHYLSYQEAQDILPTLTDIYDEPFADSSAIPTLLVSKFAKEQVKVALSGDGGDEQFLGYGMYTWAKRLAHPAVKMSSGLLKQLFHVSGKSRLQRIATLFDYRPGDVVEQHIFSQEQYLFSSKEVEGLLGISTEPYHTPHLGRALTASEKQAFFDLTHYLPDDLLVKVDRASMHHSLEVRVPLLDHNITEYALNLDDRLKIHQGHQKYILKEILSTYIPRDLVYRQKWGFSIPLIQWLKTDLYYLIETYLSKEAIESAQIVPYASVEKLIHLYLNGKDYLYNRLWALIVLHMWHKQHG